MAYKDPERQREYNRLRGISRRTYFREYRRLHPQIQTNISHGTSMGYMGEELALKVLVGSKRINRPCDLSWEGKLVDVKTAMPTKENGRTIARWKFLLKQKQSADSFLLIRKDINDKVIDIHLIPSKAIRGNNLSFNENTVIKYKKYLLSL